MAYRRFLPLTLLATLVLAACSDDPPTASSVDLASADVVIVTEDMAYLDPPAEIDGGTVTLGLDNQGRAPHDVTFENELGTVVSADGGEQDIAEVTLDPGTYTVYCSVAGHRQAGMEFEVTVT